MTIRGAGVYGGNTDWAGVPAGTSAPVPPHTCNVAAVVGSDVFRCRSHEDSAHHFAAHWPMCPAPFCKLPPDHEGLHDIPAGKAVVVTTEGEGP